MASDKMLGSFDQKSAPEDNDLLVEYDAAASKVKNVKFGGVWNWIVKKLTSAVINELQTSSKNVVGAINELNSKKAICTTGWTNGNAKSIFEIFSPTSPIGIYSYYNIKDIPFYPSPSDAYVTIIKGHELIIVFNEQSIFITGSSRNIWTKKWHSIKLGIIS